MSSAAGISRRAHTWLGALSLALLTTGVSSLHANPSWNGDLFPPADARLAMAYDSARHVVVRFGGWDNSPNVDPNDGTWEWDGDRWTKRTPANSPTARYSHAMAYDSARGRVVLFGGQDFITGLQSDTWEWDGVNWTQSTPSTSPPARFGSGLAYDSARGRVVLFGGFDAHAQRLADTWEWDGSDWTQVTPATSPSPRYGLALAYDSARGRVVLFGGRDAQGLTLNDTWLWDGTDWTQAAPATSPQGRYAHALAYDPARGRVVLFGGTSTSNLPTRLSDTWEWDGSDWTERTPAAGPAARSTHALAFDGTRDRVLLFGGLDIDAAGHQFSFSDTWEWDGIGWTRRTGAIPPPRNGAAMAYDSARRRVVVFGGRAFNAFQGFFYDLADTWEWDGSVWTQRFPATSPPARAFHGLAYDSARGCVVLFGGQTVDNTAFGDTWEWDGSQWTQRTPAVSPSARGSYAMAYDARRGRVVLSGGLDPRGIPYADTWEWDGSNWAHRIPAGGVEPCCAVSGAMVYDSARGRIVHFGGAGDAAPSGSDETWEWDGTTWTRRTPPTNPSGRWGHKMAYDSARGRVVMFGGVVGGVPTADAWEWDGTTWTETTPGTSPSPRYYHSMAYDGARGRIVVFGGLGTDFYSPIGDTWVYSEPCGHFADAGGRGRLLFSPRCTSDASALPQDLYDSATMGLFHGAHDIYYLSSSGLDFSSLVAQDSIHVNGLDSGLGPYRYRPGVPPVSLDVPIENTLVPAPPPDVTAMIPSGLSNLTFDLLDTQRTVYGNTAIYLLADCRVGFGPAGNSIDFTSHDDQVSGNRPPEFEVRYGLLSQLRGDRDFTRASCLGHFTDTPAALALPNPPAGEGYYFLARGLSSASCNNYGDSSLMPDPRRALDGAPICP